MNGTATRDIVTIDEDKCDGCGLCVPSCAEGAIRIIDGKARLVGDNLCDGLGNCLGTCPNDAITIERRPAEAFDEAAVEAHKAQGEPHSAPDEAPGAADGSAKPQAAKPAAPRGGCPGMLARKLIAPAEAAPAQAPRAGRAATQLTHWPVQLALLPARGDMWQDADVLIAADCVGFAVPDFHERLLAGKTLAVACPKLDDVQPYVEKLAQVFAANNVRSVTVAHMEVPCCTGIVHVVRTALRQAKREDIPVTDITIGLDGSILRVH